MGIRTVTMKGLSCLNVRKIASQSVQIKKVSSQRNNQVSKVRSCAAKEEERVSKML